MRSTLATLCFRATVVLTSVLAASACGLSSNARNPFDGSLAQGQEDRLSIHIQNKNFNDVTVFPVSSGQRVHVGSVTGKTDGNFRLNWNYAGAVSFQKRVVGGRDCNTAPIAVDPGARSWVQIPIEIGAVQCRSGRA